ncbi:hypothetical protein DFP72DRAFT_156826 [Ephemerocybe angulata]|uniref:Uncharacterized protein n=1 Tax=Ephemerocybe angulata TaxID=980116 RepID=A0A8H6HBK7_9AGAR|nr:hypothetical protein DFP72DRAFT_156826 [Tulosesus angulatus]
MAVTSGWSLSCACLRRTLRTTRATTMPSPALFRRRHDASLQDGRLAMCKLILTHYGRLSMTTLRGRTENDIFMQEGDGGHC